MSGDINPTLHTAALGALDPETVYRLVVTLESPGKSAWIGPSSVIVASRDWRPGDGEIRGAARVPLRVEVCNSEGIPLPGSRVWTRLPGGSWRGRPG